MRKVETYLKEFNNKIIRIINSNNSFTSLYNYLELDKIKFNKTYDYEETLSRLLVIKDLINKVSSIIYKPHIKVDTNEIILRSELANKLSNESFLKTTKDSRLWKYKNNELTPEYVYSIENIDTILTYENRFISLLISLIYDELDEINVLIEPLIESLLEKYEISDITYGEYSIFKEFNNYGYPYKNVFSERDSNPNKVYNLAKSLLKRIKILMNTEFYKINIKHKLDKNVLPTNILIHDDLYAYCYKFYKNNYLSNIVNELDNLTLDTYYYNYVLISFIKYLSILNIGKTKASFLTSFNIDNNNRIRFKMFSFKKGVFSYIIKEDNDNLGFIIETRFIDNKVKTNSKVNKDKSSLYYIKSIYSYNNDNYPLVKSYLNNKLNIEYYDNVILFTHMNLVRKYDNVATLSYYKDNHQLLFKNIINSLSMLFDSDHLIYESKCPVCGKHNITYDGYNYICNDCGSIFSLFNSKKENNKELLWIKSFRKEN